MMFPLTCPSPLKGNGHIRVLNLLLRKVISVLRLLIR